MGLREIDVAGNQRKKGMLGELRICQIILENTPKDTIKDVYIDNGKIDIEITRHLIEVKYWDLEDCEDKDKTLKHEINGLIDQLKDYKNAIVNEKQGKKVILAFYKKLSEEDFNKVVEEINNNFEDWKDWLTICNGNHEFEEFITNEYKY
jgi:uncharacterized protein YlaN (UPF0358 family)